MLILFFRRRLHPDRNCVARRLFNGTGRRGSNRHRFQYSDDEEETNEASAEGTLRASAAGKSKLVHSAKVQKILEKGRVNLIRSKSELGEQHKKMISHLNRSRNELGAQNRKLMASISSGVERSRKKLNKAAAKAGNGSLKRRRRQHLDEEDDGCGTLRPNGDGTILNGDEEDEEDEDDEDVCGEEVDNRDRTDDLTLDLSPMPSRIHHHDNGATLKGNQPPPPPCTRDLDSMLVDLGINPTYVPAPSSNRVTSSTITTTSITTTNGRHSSPVPAPAPIEHEPSPLELRLEEDYGEEFEYMDSGDMTLTRTTVEDKTKSDSGFADEVFSELSRSSTFKRGSQLQTQPQPQQQQPIFFYGTQLRSHPRSHRHGHHPHSQQQKQKPWHRRDSLSQLPTTDIITTTSETNGEAATNKPAADMAARRHRRLSTSSYTSGVNLSYESLITSSYGEKISSEAVNGYANENGGGQRSTLESDHRLGVHNVH